MRTLVARLAPDCILVSTPIDMALLCDSHTNTRFSPTLRVADAGVWDELMVARFCRFLDTYPGSVVVFASSIVRLPIRFLSHFDEVEIKTKVFYLGDGNFHDFLVNGDFSGKSLLEIAPDGVKQFVELQNVTRGVRERVTLWGAL